MSTGTPGALPEPHDTLPLGSLPRGTLPQLDTAVVRRLVGPAVRRAAERGWSLDDLDWAGLRPELLSEADRSVVRFITYVEDHIPGYLSWLLTAFPVDGADLPVPVIATHREYFRFFVAWAHDEEQHAAVLTHYQERSGMADPETLRLDLAAEGRKHFSLPYLEPLETFAYTMIQEKATQLFYQQFRHVVSEPLLADLLLRLARDEARHYALYSRVVEQYLRRDSAAATPYLKQVLRTFRMPLAETLPRYRHWSNRVAATVGYDHTEAYECLLRMVDRYVSRPGTGDANDLSELWLGTRTLP
jgi:acyl-[acyl-carrier-protein] desaturase